MLKKKRVIFTVALLLLFAATAITFARSTATAAVSITAGGTAGEASSIKTLADVGTSTKLEYSTGAPGSYTHTPPSWSPVIDQAGSITPGDVYYLDCTGYTGDVMVTVYLTNPGALSKDYSYLDMQINIWSGTSPTWTQATLADGTDIDTQYLTLTNGYYSFILNGNTHYCITVDDGSYYCIDTDAAGGSISPAFYIDVKPV